LEHPFFVYGQGWASCNPEGSQQLFGLKCQRLQVGDICISLKPREHKTHQQAKHQQMQTNDYQPRPSNSYPQHANMHQPKNSFPVSPSQTPQNLSKRPQTNTTNATDITTTSRLAPHLVPYSSVQSLATSTTAATTLENRNAHIENGLMNGRGNGRCVSPPPQRRRPLSHENPTGNLRGHVDDSQPVSMVLNDKSQSPTTSEESIASRKRRWSAPDMVDDDDEQVQPPPISQLART
jgi:Ataxin-1 and HBP1 module (AXH)